MITVIEAGQSEQEKWDAYVCSHAGATPYHLYAWKKAVQQAYGHKAYYLMAVDSGQVTGVLPLVHLRLTFIIQELVALPFCDVGHPLYDNAEVLHTLLAHAVKLGERLHAKKIELRGELPGHGASAAGFAAKKSDKMRMLFALPDCAEDLWNGFKSKLRSQIRKAGKNGVSFRWAGQEGVEPFYAVFCHNMRKLGSPVHASKWFAAVMDNYGDSARIGLAEYNGQCIGAGIILRTPGQAAVPWASTLPAFNHLSPNMLLYWNFLKFAADNGMHSFDFGRSTENEGTYTFKKQWGAQPVPLQWFGYSPEGLPAEGSGQEAHRSRAAQIWQRFPLPLANLLGPVCRKYISL